MCWDNLYQFGARLGTIVYSHKPTQGTRLDGASYILQNPFYDETIIISAQMFKDYLYCLQCPQKIHDKLFLIVIRPLLYVSNCFF